MSHEPWPVARRFWSKVDKRGDDDCWNWVGAKGPKGHGVMGRGRRGQGLMGVHRVSYEMHKGPIPPGLCVMHSCDNPACANPKHLSVGTLADNNADMFRKRRHRFGERHPDCRLTAVEVAAIRTMSGIHSEIGKMFGVSQSHISRIKNGDARRWD